MLPIYEAIAFEGILQKGGRTKPWLIWVSANGIQTYVVKIFTTEQVHTRYCVENEVLGHVLAQEFDLSVPAAALIDFSETFKARLPLEAQIILDARDERLKFGSLLISPNNPFSPGISKGIIKRKIDIESALAFDCLIRNRDRNNSKPNIIINKEKAFLIDHELGFEKVLEGIQDFKNGIVDYRFVEGHIFYNYLKRAHISAKSEYFAAFHEYLRLLNVNKLAPYFLQLENAGYVTRRATIMQYLQLIKENSGTFVDLIKEHFQ